MTPLKTILSASALALAALPMPVAAQMLPAPYVSRALDAVLIPIDRDVRAAFGLAARDRGVLVLATEPGGVADVNGIWPGDVLQLVGSRRVTSPAQVDEVVWWWILQGVTDFGFDVWRDGGWVEVYAVVTEEYFWQAIEVTEVSSWSSYEYSSFSYEEYAYEYSEEISESYEVSETSIEETVSSEAFSSEMSEESSEVTEEAAAALEAEGEGEGDEEGSDESADGLMDDGSADEGAEDAGEVSEDGSEEDASVEDGSDEALAEDDAGEGDEPMAEDFAEDPAEKYVEEPMEEDYVEEPVEEYVEEGGGDEGGYDEGGE